MLELKVPDIGGINGVNVAEVYVKVGDSIKVDDNLIMLETDKATMEVPATSAGIVREVIVKVGSKISEGDVILKLEADDAKVAAEDTPAAKEQASSSMEKSVIAQDNATAVRAVDNSKVNCVNAESIDDVAFSNAHASPRIRKLARELNVDLAKIPGSGNNGRITEEDLTQFVKRLIANGGTGGNGGGINGLDLLPWPRVDFAKFGAIESKELSRIKKLAGANLARNWVMIPHVTQFDEANITELENFRKQLNEEYKKAEIKISPLAFLIKACVFALKKYPEFNASLDGDYLIYKKYFHIGFAADTAQGLVVPVLKDADKKGIVEIAQETSNLAKCAREGKLKPTDMQGGTFTISSLGGIGGTAFTPIVNAPEVAILGVSKTQIKPVWDGKAFVPGLMLPLSLSYDHRVIDGALAARFTSYLSEVLSDIRRLSL